MDLQQISDYNNFLSLLLDQYKTKENFKSILEAVGEQSNDIETAIFELKDEYDLNTAVGDQLDVIGSIIGLTRDGRIDDNYRILLKVKAEINSSAGTPESLIKTAVALYDATEVEYVPVYPAKVQLWTDGDIGLTVTHEMALDGGTDNMILDDGGILEVETPDDIAEQLLYDILPAGVGLLLADNLILDDTGFLYLDDGGHMILT